MSNKTNTKSVTVTVNSKKEFWKSKTLWVNIIGLAAILYQGFNGEIVSIEMQTSLLAIANVMLRMITKDEIVW